MRCNFIVAFSAILAVLAAGAHCQAQPSNTECLALSEIAMDGMLKVRLSEVAQDKATSKDVQAFARRIVADGSKTNELLTQAASQDRIKLPTELTPSQFQIAAELTATPNNAFDRRYMMEMVIEYRKTVEELAKEARTGTGNAKRWAAETLPLVETRKRDAETLATRMGAYAK